MINKLDEVKSKLDQASKIREQAYNALNEISKKLSDEIIYIFSNRVKANIHDRVSITWDLLTEEHVMLPEYRIYFSYPDAANPEKEDFCSRWSLHYRNGLLNFDYGNSGEYNRIEKPLCIQRIIDMNAIATNLPFIETEIKKLDPLFAEWKQADSTVDKAMAKERQLEFELDKLEIEELNKKLKVNSIFKYNEAKANWSSRIESYYTHEWLKLNFKIIKLTQKYVYIEVTLDLGSYKYSTTLRNSLKISKHEFSKKIKEGVLQKIN